MKHLAIGFGLIFSGLIYADNAAFQEHKATVLQDIDAKLARINEHRTCVNNATTWEAIKACNESIKAWHEAKQKENTKKKEQMEKHKKGKK